MEPERVAVLHLLAADRDVHGQGIGTKLLRAAADLAREEGDEVIRLDTLTYNYPAQKMYEKFGYVPCGDVELTYATTGTVPFRMYEYKV